LVESQKASTKKQMKDVFMELLKYDTLSGTNIQIKDIHIIICLNKPSKLADELIKLLKGDHKDINVNVTLKMFYEIIDKLREFK